MQYCFLNYYCESLLQNLSLLKKMEGSENFIEIIRQYCLICCYLRKWTVFDLPIYLPPEIKPLCTLFQAVCEANGWSKKYCNSKWNKLYPAMPSHLAKRKFTFILFFFASFPTNKNCYFIAKPYLYVFCCSTKLGIRYCTGMADFEQFIYFILRCACFSRVFFCLPSMLLLLLELSLSTAYVFAVSGVVVGLKEENKKIRNSTTISWRFGNQLAVTFLVLSYEWKYIEKLFTFLLVYLTFHFLFARYLFTRLCYTTPAKLQIEN